LELIIGPKRLIDGLLSARPKQNLQKERYTTSGVRVVLKDTGYKDDVDKTNVVQILKQADIREIRSL